MNSAHSNSSLPVANSARVNQLFQEQLQSVTIHTDWLFSRLMVCQWFFGIGLALWLSPKTWQGTHSAIHPHVWYAVFIGGIITCGPVFLAITQAGKTLTRHVIGIGQVLMSGL